MKNSALASILFTCTQCNANFEFDAIGENEFVPCPICGANHVTVKIRNKIMLKTIEQTLMC